MQSEVHMTDLKRTAKRNALSRCMQSQETHKSGKVRSLLQVWPRWLRVHRRRSRPWRAPERRRRVEARAADDVIVLITQQRSHVVALKRVLHLRNGEAAAGRAALDDLAVCAVRQALALCTRTWK